MKEKKNGLSLDLIIHPGETLFELLGTRNMKQKELALKTGYSEKHISKVINCMAPITSRFAVALENVFDVSAKFWLNLQANYDIEMIGYSSMSKMAAYPELETIDIQTAEELREYMEDLMGD